MQKIDNTGAARRLILLTGSRICFWDRLRDYGADVPVMCVRKAEGHTDHSLNRGVNSPTKHLLAA
jgi:hypothetical protein